MRDSIPVRVPAPSLNCPMSSQTLFALKRLRPRDHRQRREYRRRAEAQRRGTAQTAPSRTSALPAKPMRGPSSAASSRCSPSSPAPSWRSREASGAPRSSRRRRIGPSGIRHSGSAPKWGLSSRRAQAGGGSDGNTTSRYTATLDGMGAVCDARHARHEHLHIGKTLERTALLTLLLMSEPADAAGAGA